MHTKIHAQHELYQLLRVALAHSSINIGMAKNTEITWIIPEILSPLLKFLAMYKRTLLVLGIPVIAPE